MSRSTSVGCAPVLAALAGAAGCGTNDATGPYGGVRLNQGASLEIAAVLVAEMAVVGLGSSPGAPPGRIRRGRRRSRRR